MTEKFVTADAAQEAQRGIMRLFRVLREENGPDESSIKTAHKSLMVGPLNP